MQTNKSTVLNWTQLQVTLQNYGRRFLNWSWQCRIIFKISWLIFLLVMSAASSKRLTTNTYHQLLNTTAFHRFQKMRVQRRHRTSLKMYKTGTMFGQKPRSLVSLRQADNVSSKISHGIYSLMHATGQSQAHTNTPRSWKCPHQLSFWHRLRNWLTSVTGNRLFPLDFQRSSSLHIRELNNTVNNIPRTRVSVVFDFFLNFKLNKTNISFCLKTVFWATTVSLCVSN